MYIGVEQNAIVVHLQPNYCACDIIMMCQFIITDNPDPPCSCGGTKSTGVQDR